MSKHNHEHHEETPLFKILTKSTIQDLLKEQLTFTHGLLKEEKPVSGILTVASVEETDEEEEHGEGCLNCAPHLYYTLMMNAIETTLSAMDQEFVLGQFGLDPVVLASEMIDFLATRINTALGIESGKPEDLDRLLDEHPDAFDFIDSHISSLIFVAGDDLDEE